MRTAPAVSVTTGGGPLWRALNVALPCLALAVFVAWAARHAGWSSMGAGAVAAGVAAAAAAAFWGRALRRRGARPSSVGDPEATAGQRPAGAAAAPELRFDGHAWTLGGMPGRPEVAIDLQRWLLLRFVAADPPPPDGPRTVEAGPAGSAPPARWLPSPRRHGWRPRRRVHWVAVSAAEAAGALHALRVALHAPLPVPAAGPPALPSADPPAAPPARTRP